MFTLIRPRRWTAWLAMWVLVLNALAPLVAQAAVARQEAGHWVEVCTSTGMVRVQAVDFEGAPAAPSGNEFNLGQHCPACTVHDLALALPPAELRILVLRATSAVAHYAEPPVFDRRVALAAPARAPPLN